MQPVEQMREESATAKMRKAAGKPHVGLQLALDLLRDRDVEQAAVRPPQLNRVVDITVKQAHRQRAQELGAALHGVGDPLKLLLKSDFGLEVQRVAERELAFRPAVAGAARAFPVARPQVHQLKAGSGEQFIELPEARLFHVKGTEQYFEFDPEGPLGECRAAAPEDRELRALRVDLDEIDVPHVVRGQDAIERVDPHGDAAHDLVAVRVREAVEEFPVRLEQRGSPAVAAEVEGELGWPQVQRGIDVERFARVSVAREPRVFVGVRLESDYPQVGPRPFPIGLQPAARADVDQGERLRSIMLPQRCSKENVHVGLSRVEFENLAIVPA